MKAHVSKHIQIRHTHATAVTDGLCVGNNLFYNSFPVHAQNLVIVCKLKRLNQIIVYAYEFLVCHMN